jgi:hypothetical protein
LGKYTSYITGALTFSFGFYVSFLVIFYMKDKLGAITTSNNKYINKIDEKLANELHEKIITFFEVKKIYIGLSQNQVKAILGVCSSLTK